MSSKLFVYVTVLRGYYSYESAEEQHCVYGQRHLAYVRLGVAQVGFILGTGPYFTLVWSS